jgi:hypothetical protein
MLDMGSDEVIQRPEPPTEPPTFDPRRTVPEVVAAAVKKVLIRRKRE